MSTKENNSRKRDSTVLDSTSTNTSEKRVRTAEAVEEIIKTVLRINNISENDIDIQSLKKSLQYTFGTLLTLRELIYLTEVIQDMKKKRNNHLYDIHYNEENGCTRVLISSQSGKLYEGGWKNNMFNGKGVLYFSNGNKFIIGIPLACL